MDTWEKKFLFNNLRSVFRMWCHQPDVLDTIFGPLHKTSCICLHTGSFHLIHLMFDDYVLYLLESLHCQERANDLMRAMKGEGSTGEATSNCAPPSHLIWPCIPGVTLMPVLFWHLQQRERRNSRSRRPPPPPHLQNPTHPLDPSTLWASPQSAPRQKPCPPSTPGWPPPQVTPTEMSWINRCLTTRSSSAPTHFSSVHKCVYQALFSLIHGPLHTQWQQPGALPQRLASSFPVCGTAPQFHHRPQPTGCQCTHTERSMGNYD